MTDTDPQYRLVVRFTNKDIVCQIVHAKLQGDFVLTAAYAHELPRYGIKHGLTNWAAAYATGLLCARRALTKLGLADKYEGQVEPDGSIKEVEALGEGNPRPFKCYLDTGLKRTTTGSRLFGAMKGASDGGIFIPHNSKRFPGYDIESKELDEELLKGYIFGAHVSQYMESLEEEDDEKCVQHALERSDSSRFKKVFSRYLEDDIGSEDIEEVREALLALPLTTQIYAEAHKAIREDPSIQKKEYSESDLAGFKETSSKGRCILR